MERKFKGVWIPAEVWLNPALTATEKMLYAEIDSFTGRGATFFKANETIAKDMGVSASTVKRSLSRLIHSGLVVQLSYDGRTRHLQSLDLSDSINLNHEIGQNDPSDRSKENRLIGQNDPISKQVKYTRESTKEKMALRLPDSFNNDEFKAAWDTWKQYKKEEHRFEYKSYISQDTTIHKLHNDTEGSPKRAILAIGNAIARGWKGIFPQNSDTSEREQPIDTTTALEWADK